MLEKTGEFTKSPSSNIRSNWNMISNFRQYKNGILYNKEKRVIYNIAPYPITQENQYLKEVKPISIMQQDMGLEKHVHFNPFIESYYIKNKNNHIRHTKKRRKKYIKDSLLLYKQKKQNVK